MFGVYLYSVLIFIIMIVLYLFYDQIVISIKENKERLLKMTLPIVKCENYYFEKSFDQINTNKNN